MVWAMPSAAVGSSSRTTELSAPTARAMAMAWRCPPDRLPTRARTECSVRTCSRSKARRAVSSIASSSSGRRKRGRNFQPRITGSAPSARFAATSRFSQSARSW